MPMSEAATTDTTVLAIAVYKQRPANRAVNYYTTVSEIAVYQQHERDSSRNYDSHASNRDIIYIHILYILYIPTAAPPLDKLVSSEQRRVQDRPLS